MMKSFLENKKAYSNFELFLRLDEIYNWHTGFDWVFFIHLFTTFNFMKQLQNELKYKLMTLKVMGDFLRLR